MSAERECRTCAHLEIPLRCEPCRTCSLAGGSKPNWTPVAVAPAPDTGYGCQTCKFCAVDPNAAPCRGCWSPSVSGKGSNWTAP